MKFSKYNFHTILIAILCLLHFNNLLSQQIIGKITDEDENPLSNVTISIKDSKDNSTLLNYAISDSQGTYSLKINDLKSFTIIYQSLAYITKEISFENFSKNENPYILNIVLEKSLTELDEVFITSKREPIIQKKDTTVYNPNRFRDGTERVVEDLLKKLPGINVASNGKITFKGNPIETVLLDGDNLFEERYNIGTKNIDIDMVESVSAIENYINNPLLHGIANTTAVAINLTLKKGKADFSGTSNLGGGIENRVDSNINVLGISKKNKSFSTISYNNIGNENSPYDFFSPNKFALENNKSIDFKPNKIIQESYLTSDISEERSRINRNFFTSLNSIFNISNKLGAKLNFDYKNDRLSRSSQTQTKFINTLLNTDINQLEKLIKKPEIFNLNIGFNYKLSDIELIETKTNISNEEINTNYDINLNDINQNSSINSSERQIQQVLNYTKRMGARSALISSFIFNNINLSQYLFITPELRFQDDGESSNQSIDIGKTNLNLNAYFLNSGQNYNYKVGLGFSYEDVEFYSLLSGINQEIPFSENNLNYINYFPWLEANLFFRLNNWNFRTNLKLKYSHQKLEDLTLNSDNKQLYNFQFLPESIINFNINENENIRLKSIYKERLINEGALFENVIFTSNRNIQSNIANLVTLKNYSIDLSYNHNDFFNLFQFYSAINYTKNINNYFSTIDIDDLFVVNRRELLNLSFDNLSLNSGLDRYVNFLKSNLKLNLSYGRNTYKNIINNSEIRDNISHSGFLNFILKTGFLGALNFENNFQFATITFKTDNSETVFNSSLQNSFKVFVKPSQRIYITTSFDYYLPNINKPESYLYFDTAINITSKNQRVTYAIISKNISTKNNTFSKTDISDFSNTQTSYNLNKPYLLFSMNFKF